MKKYLSVIIAVLVTISFISCDEEIIPTSEDGVELRFDITVTRADDFGTKAIKKNWEDGDKIFLFFSKKGTTHKAMNKYVTLTYNGSTWETVASSGLDAYSDLYSYGKMHAIYFPFGDVINNGSNFLSSGNDNVALNNILVFSYYLEDHADYTIGMMGGIATLSGNLHLSLPDNYVYFYIDEDEGKFNQNGKYRLSVEGVKPTTINSISSGSFTKYQLGAGQPMWGFKYGNGIAFAGVLEESRVGVEQDYKMFFFSDGDPAVTKTYSGKTLSSRSSVKLKSPIAGNNGWSQAISAPDYTLMGDGLKWGRWNLGCTSLADESSGLSFCWGEIATGNNNYYPISNNNSLVYVDAEHDYSIFDVAKAYLGSNWRMPTKSEFDALKNSCDYSLTFSGGSVTGGAFSGDGMIFTSNTGGNTNSIVLRAKSGGSLNYWTTTANGSDNKAYYYSVSSGPSFSSGINWGGNAYPIRPIYIGE